MNQEPLKEAVLQTMPMQVEKDNKSHSHTEEQHIFELISVIQEAVPQALQKFKEGQVSGPDPNSNPLFAKPTSGFEKILLEELTKGMLQVHKTHHPLADHEAPILPKYLSKWVKEALEQQEIAGGQEKLPIAAMKATPANLKLAAQAPIEVDPKQFYKQFKADHGEMLEAMGKVE